MRKTESRRYSREERVRRRDSEGRPDDVSESVTATANCIGGGITRATSPLWVSAFVRPSPSLQQASAAAALHAASDLAQHAIRVFADASQPTHTVAKVGMNPIRSASAVTTAVRRERMGSILDASPRTVKSTQGTGVAMRCDLRRL
jgi:hypothetical protein